MATNFPTSLDNLSNPASNNKLGDAGVLHSDQHSNANDAIEALQAKVGINSSANTNSLDYKVTSLTSSVNSLQTTVSGINLSNYIPTSQKAAASGVASLDSSTKVPVAQLPDAVIPHVYVQANNTVANPQVGDILVRTDLNLSYVYNNGGWQQLLNTSGGGGTAGVSSINGQTGGLTFTGAGVSVSGTTFTFSGGGSSLPTQTGNTGKYLTTDGTTASWATVTAGTVLPSQTSNSGKYLTTDGTTLSWATVSGGGVSLPTYVSGKYLTNDGTNLSWATIDLSAYVQTSTLTSTLTSYAPKASPTFTGTVVLPDGTVTSAMILDGTIVDADISSTAAISQTKISGLSTTLAAKANLASPIFTGTPAAPTAAATTNTTQIATTAFVKTAISNLVGSAPAALDTLQELAAQLQADESAAATLTTLVGTKAPSDSPTFTGTITTPLTTAGFIKTNSSGQLSSQAKIDNGDLTNSYFVIDGTNYYLGGTLPVGGAPYSNGSTTGPNKIYFNNTGVQPSTNLNAGDIYIQY